MREKIATLPSGKMAKERCRWLIASIMLRVTARDQKSVKRSLADACTTSWCECRSHLTPWVPASRRPTVIDLNGFAVNA